MDNSLSYRSPKAYKGSYGKPPGYDETSWRSGVLGEQLAANIRAGGAAVFLRRYEAPGHCVYFVSAHELKRVKIGRTNNIYARLSKFKVHSPVDIRLWLVIACHTKEDAINKEKELHDKFTSFRIKGEWFMIVREIEEYVLSQP